MRRSSPSSPISRPSTAWTATTLAHASGDAVNAILAAAGYNFSLLLTWLRLLLFRLLILLSEPAQPRAA